MDEQTMFALLVDLHRDGPRQGPGSDAETLRALELTRIDRDAALDVADIGCGVSRADRDPGGILAVSEITWLRPDPPDEVRRHWESEYPEIGTASEKIAILEREGYDLLGYTVLPPAAWTDAYYRPTGERIPAFLERHQGEPEAAEVARLEREEADLYRRYQDWFGYGFYIARRR